VFYDVFLIVDVNTIPHIVWVFDEEEDTRAEDFLCSDLKTI
jgi:hypothetical protein